MKKIFIVMLIVVIFGAVAFAQQEKDAMPIEPKKSDELEKALKNIEYKCDPYIEPEQAQIKIYDQIKPYSDKMNKKDFIAAIAAALGSNDADIRYNAAGYLLSKDSIVDKRLIVFVRDTLEKLVESINNKITLYDEHGDNEIWWLVQLTAKYPDIQSIPILIKLAGLVPVRAVAHVETTDEKTLNIRQYKSYFEDVASALKACSNGAIGEIPVKPNWGSAFEEGEKLVEKWNLWWNENKEKLMTGIEKELDGPEKKEQEDNPNNNNINDTYFTDMVTSVKTETGTKRIDSKPEKRQDTKKEETHNNANEPAETVGWPLIAGLIAGILLVILLGARLFRRNST